MTQVRRRALTGCSRAALPAATLGVEAPLSPTSDEQVEEEKAEQNGGIAAVEHRVEALWSVWHGRSDRHHARKHESDRSSEQADQQEQSAEGLEHAGEAVEGEQGRDPALGW